MNIIAIRDNYEWGSVEKLLIDGEVSESIVFKNGVMSFDKMAEIFKEINLALGLITLLTINQKGVFYE